MYSRLILLVLFGLATKSPTQAQEAYPLFFFEKAKDTLVFNKAWVHYDSNEFRKSINTLNKIKKEYDQDAAVNRLYALNFIELKEYPSAVLYFGKALGSDPEAYELYRERASIYLEIELYKLAVADLYAYHLYDPDDVTALYNLAWSMNKTGRQHEAIELLRRSDKKDGDCLYLLSSLYNSSGDEEAEYSTLKQFAVEYPQHVHGMDALFVYYYDQGSYPKALEIIDKLLAVNEDYARGYYLRAICYDEMGRHFEAEQEYAQASILGYRWEEEE